MDTNARSLCPYCAGRHSERDCPLTCTLIPPGNRPTVPAHSTSPAMGWVCPQCGRGMAPTMPWCDCMTPKEASE